MSQRKEQKERKRPMREWTVMFYFASDNPLAPSTVQQLKAIKNAGYHRDVNVLAHFDPHSSNTPPHIYDVNLINKIKNPAPNIGFNGNDPFVRNLVMDKLWPEGEIRTKIQEEMRKKSFCYDPPKPTDDMSREQNPKQSLDNFLTFCRKEYPARHYLLFIMGHGLVVGNDLFLLDENAAPNDFSSPQNSLLLTDFGKVIKKFKAKITHQGELELIGFHSCSMSGLEVAYELRDTANYMLASQGPAFVGSWPYRQILIELFNRIEASANSNGHHKSTEDTGTVQSNGKKAITAAVGIGARSSHASLRPKYSAKHAVKSSPRVETSGHIAVNGANSKGRKLDVKDMLTSFFYYCLYNSYDFHLAGYSFDLCLCSLKRVVDIEKPLQKLSQALIDGLRDDGSNGKRQSVERGRNEDLPARDPVLLAHWEAQSFYEEKYTDLYDFCFRLRQERKYESETTKRIMTPIRKAALDVMKMLKRGVSGYDKGMIVRSESAGPGAQYAHGLSVFFPWSEPVGNRMWDEHYEQFELIEKTSWGEFLKEYFAKTKRETQAQENDTLDKHVKLEPGLTEKLLELFDEFTTHIFNEAGQLKGGPGDAVGPGKAGSLDPAGSDCTCGSIKNYPTYTGPRGAKVKNGGTLASPNFCRRIRSEMNT